MKDTPKMLSHNSQIAMFCGVSWNDLHRGRPWAMSSELINRGYQIIFIEPPTSPLRWIAMKELNIKNLKDYLINRVIFNNKLKIIHQLPLLPFGGYIKWVRDWNRVFLNLQFSSIFKHADICLKSCVCIVSELWWYNLLKNQTLGVLCYDCVDDVKLFSGRYKYRLYYSWHIELIKRANIIFACSLPLKEQILSVKPTANVIHLPNGVNADWFKKQASALPTPPDLLKVPKPIVGFVGLIGDWIDKRLIYESARELSMLSFVIIGPGVGSPAHKLCAGFPTLPNLYILGPKPYSQIPAYIEGFDVCLLPLNTDEIGDAADPLKVYEYLALGKPVVSTNIASICKKKELKDYIYIAKDTNEFIDCIKDALHESGELKLRREMYARKNSWEIRVEQMLNAIRRII